MEIKVQSASGNASNLAVNDALLACDYNEALIHQVVTQYMNTARSGNKANKNRSAVRGGGAKPWRQKGTGRARAGTIRSPLWRGGGVTFAASPRSYAKKLNKKMYRKAMASIVSELLRSERLHIVDEFKLATPKTKDFKQALQQFGVTDNVLVVVDELDENLILASRNLPHTDVYEAQQLDPLSLIAFDQVVMTVAALKKFEEKVL